MQFFIFYFENTDFILSFVLKTIKVYNIPDVAVSFLDFPF